MHLGEFSKGKWLSGRVCLDGRLEQGQRCDGIWGVHLGVVCSHRTGEGMVLRAAALFQSMQSYCFSFFL